MFNGKINHDIEFEKLREKLRYVKSKEETIQLLEQIVSLKPKDSKLLTYRNQYKKELPTLKKYFSKENINCSSHDSKCFNGSKMLVIAANGVGDFMFFLPLFQHIARYPDEKTLIIRDDVYPFVSSFCHSFNSVIRITIHNPDDSYDTLVSYSSYININFDIIINLFSEEALVRKVCHMICAELISFDPYEGKKEGKHISDEVLENLDRLSKICADESHNNKCNYGIKIKEDVLMSADDFIKRNGIQKYIVICPHGQNSESLNNYWDKDIPIRGLQFLVNGLSSIIPIIILGTNQKYRKCFENNKSAFNLIGKTTLIEAGAFIQKAELFIGADCGLMHIADVMGKGIIGLFGPTDPDWVGPKSSNAIIFSTYKTSKLMSDLSYELILKRLLMTQKLSV